MRVLMFLAMFFLLGAFFIISNENLHIGKSDELKVFGEHYYAWFSGLFDNFKSITGYVVESKWLPSHNYN